MPYIRLPDDSYFKFPDGESPEAAYARAQQKYPEAFKPPVKPDTGFTGAFKSSLENLKGDIEAIKTSQGVEGAEEKAAAYREQAKKIFKPTEEGWLEAPFEKTKELIGGSLPYMAAPIVGGIGGRFLGGAEAATGLAGLLSAAQFTGSNLSRQLEEGTEGKDLNFGAAALSSIPQAALDMVSFKMTPAIKRLFGEAGKQIPETVAKRIADQGIAKTLQDYAAQGIKTAGIEGATEAGQQFFERLQAGLSLTDEKARDEYFENFIGGAVLGGALAVPGRFVERGSIKSEERAQAAKEEQDKLFKEQEAADAERRSPENVARLKSRQAELNGLSFELNAILKDPNTAEEAKEEAKDRLAAIGDELKNINDDLAEIVPSAAPAVRSLDDVLRERAEQRRSLSTQAGIARARPTEIVQRFTGLDNEVDTLKTDLQTAMKEGDVAKIEQLGELLDRKTNELDKLFNVAKAAGIDIRTPTTQLKIAQLNLAKAKKALAEASENEAVALDPIKRNKLIQGVVNAQKEVDAQLANKEAAITRSAQSAALAEKQTQRLSALEEEELQGYEPFDPDKYDIKSNEDLRNKLSGLAAASRERRAAFNSLLGGEEGVTPENFEKSAAYQLDKSVNEGSLPGVYANMMGLPQPIGNAKAWYFNKKTNNTAALEELVVNEIEKIRADADFAAQYGMDLPQDPRLPYLEQMFEKLSALNAPVTAPSRYAPGQLKAKPTTHEITPKQSKLLQIKRRNRGEGNVFLQTYGKRKEAAYTPESIQKTRSEIAEIDSLLTAAKNFDKNKENAISNINKKIKKANKALEKPNADKAALNASIKVYEKSLKEAQAREALSAADVARLKRRKARLEQDIEDATLPLRTTGKVPKAVKVESQIETTENKLATARTPAQIKNLNNKLATLNEKLKALGYVYDKQTGRYVASLLPRKPAGEVKGTPVTPAGRAEGLLQEVMETIDSLRKGEFFGGAAGQEGKSGKMLESRSRPIILKGLKKDIDQLASATINAINVTRTKAKVDTLTAKEEQEIRYLIDTVLGGKALRATGWRAEKQRTPKTIGHKDTTFKAAFAAAGFDVKLLTDESKYAKAVEDASLGETGYSAEDQKVIDKLTKKVDNYNNALSFATKQGDKNKIAHYKQELAKAKEALSVAKNRTQFYSGEANDYMRNLANTVLALQEEASKIGDHLLEAGQSEATRPFRDAEGNIQYSDAMDSWRTKYARVTEAFNAAKAEYDAAMKDFVAGEETGKGEIRTGMRESERLDIKQFIETLKRKYGAEAAATKSDAEPLYLPKAKELPAEITKLEKEANDLVEENKELAKGLSELVELLIPTEARQAKAAAEALATDKRQRVPQSETPEAKAAKHSIRTIDEYPNAIAIAEMYNKGEVTDLLNEAARLDREASRIGYWTPATEAISDDLYDQAQMMRVEALDITQQLLKDLQKIYAAGKAEADAKVKKDFEDLFKKLRENTDKYKEVNAKHKEALGQHIRAEQSAEGVQRAKDRLEEAGLVARAIQAGEAKTRQQTGLGLPGTRQKVEISQGVISNTTFEAIANMNKKLSRLYAATKQEPKNAALLSANERIADMAPAKAEYAEYLQKFKDKLDENNLLDTKLGNAYLELHKVNENSPQGKALRKTIGTEIELYQENASQITQKTKVRSEIKTEATTRAEDTEALKELQAEQTEETKRTLERKKTRMSEKTRQKQLGIAENKLAKHLAKPMPEDPKEAFKYRNTTIGLKAEIDVLKHADLGILLARGLSKREKSEIRSKPTALERLYALDPAAKAKKLNSLEKQKAALIEKGEPVADKAKANYKQKLLGLEKQIGVLSREETGGVTPSEYEAQVKTVAKKDLDTAESQLEQLERTAKKVAVAEDTLEHDKTLKDEERAKLEEEIKANRAWMGAIAEKEEKLSTLFNQANKRVIYEEEAKAAAASAGVSEKEYKEISKNELGLWKPEFKDAGVDADDFGGLYEGLRGEWDARLGDVGGLGNVTAGDVRGELSTLKLPKGLKITVIEKMTPTLRGAALQSGYTEEQIDRLRGGVLPDGTVFIVANTHNNMKDVQKTIAHELIGHIGAETLVGDKGMQDLANRVAKQKGGVLGLAEALGIEDKVAAAYFSALKAGKTHEEANANAIREIIAYTTEGRVDKGILGKLNEFIKAMVGYIRAGLRKLGLDLDITTSDIYKITREATKNFAKVEPGMYHRPDGTTQYRAGEVVFGPSEEAFRSLAGRVLTKQKTLRERFWPSNIGLTIETKYFARQAPLQQVFASKGMKDSFLATQTEYYINMRDQFMTWTQQAMSTGVPTLTSTKRADGNTEHILKSVPGANLANLAKVLGEANWGNPEGVRNAYSLYRIAKRAKRVGLEVLNFRGDVTEKDLASIDRLLKQNPALKAAFDKADAIYDQYNRDLMAFLVKTGAISKAAAAEMTKYNDYVPYYRVDANDNVMLNIGGATRIRVGNLKDQPYLHDLVGGDERIVDIFTGAMQNTNLLMNMALTNLATRNVAFALSDLGMLSRREDKTGKPIGSGIRVGNGPADGKTIRFTVEPDPNIKDDDGSRYATVDTDVAGVDSRLLVQGLTGINIALPTMVKTLGIPSRLLRSWVTRNPVYAARQILRDPLVAGLASGVDELPIVASLRTAFDALQGRKSGEEKLQGYGLLGGQVLTGLPEDQQKILLHLTAGTKGWEGFKAKMDTLAMQGDAATRSVAFNNFRKQGLSEMEAIVATYKMMPFTQRGTSASLYMLSTMVPFLNAQLQGLYVLWKSFRGNAPFEEKLRIKQKLYTRGAALFAMSMIYAMMMQDDEAYKNANDDERLNNWFIKIPGVKEPFKFPVPFELGIIFKAIPESLVNVMMGDRKASEAIDALRKMIITSSPIGLSTIPTGIKAPLEIMMDYSTFTGRSIIGERLKDVLPQEQFNENTSEIAKLIGSGTGRIPVLGKYLSPIQLEYLVRSYTGSLPIVLASMANPMLASGPSAAKPETRLNEVPVFGSLFQATDAGGAINRVYADLGEATKADRTYKKLIEEGREKDAESFANRYADDLSMGKMATQFRKEMAKVAQAERAVRADRDLSPKEKRDKLDELKQTKIQIAKYFSGRE